MGYISPLHWLKSCLFPQPVYSPTCGKVNDATPQDSLARPTSWRRRCRTGDCLAGARPLPREIRAAPGADHPGRYRLGSRAVLGPDPCARRAAGALRRLQTAAIGPAAQAGCNPIGNVSPQLSGASAAPSFSVWSAHPGASEWDRLRSFGFWKPARLYAPALPAALSPCGLCDLPDPGHGQRPGCRACY